MSKKWSIATVVALATLPVATPGRAQGPAKDREQIIDVAKITQAVTESTKPLYQALEDTRLKQRFEKVKALLADKQVSKEDLTSGLKELKAGIDDFTNRWESIVEPLWAGQETLGKAIAEIRRKVPAQGEGPVPPRIRKLLDNYDRRLHELARTIKKTKDPAARKRLEKVFQNLLSLRKFTERLGQAGVEKVKVKLMLRTVQLLGRLQDQLMDATFELEKVRSILAGESAFLHDYVGLLEMARTANDLVAMLRQMREQGTGIGGVAAKVGSVQKVSNEVAAGLQRFSKSILDDLETELDKLAQEMGDTPAGAGKSAPADPDLQKQIERYTTWRLIDQTVVID